MAEHKNPTPSNFEVKYIKISAGGGEPFDVTKLVNYIDIYESIYSPFMTLEFNITDALSVVHLLQLKGEETVEVDIRNADDESGFIGQKFNLYKLSNRISISDRAYTYTLHCISPGALTDLSTRHSEAFDGKPHELAEEKFIKPLAESKEVYAHATKNKIAYISNYWTPLRNITYLCNRATSSDTDNPTYLFFENKKKFIFAPLDYLIKEDAIMTYFYGVNPQRLPIDQAAGIVHKLYSDDTFDYLKRIQSGAYGNSAMVVDSTNKVFKYTSYDFMEGFKKYARLNKLPFNSESVKRGPDSVFRSRLIAEKSYEKMPEEKTDEWFKQRLTEINSIDSQTIEIEVSGDLNILTGQVVNLFVPVTHIEQMDAGSADFSKLIDTSMSGRYLITAIHHLLDRERHIMKLKLCKDSIIDANG